MRDIRALLAEQLHELGLLRQRHVFGQRSKHDDPVNLIGLFRWKLVGPVEKGTHREKASLAMSHDRDALVILLEVGQRAIEPRRFLIESGHVAKERRLESIKDEVVVPIEPGILEQDFRFAPGVDVIADEPVNENDHVLGLKNLVPQVQQASLVMRLLAKPPFVRQPQPAQCRRIRDQRARRQLVITPGEPTPDQSRNRPESDQRDQQQNDVAISPAKPPIRSDPVACRAAVGSIIDLGVTGRTFHG